MDQSFLIDPCAEIADQLVDYAEHNLPEKEAARIAAHVAQCAACQQEVAEIRALTAEFEAVVPEVPSTKLRTNFLAMLAEEEATLQSAAAPAPKAEGKQRWLTFDAPVAWMRIAASIALVAAGVLLGLLLGPAKNSAQLVASDSPVDKSEQLAQALKIVPTPAVSASDRIQLVSQSPGNVEPGSPAVQVLINTLNFDPNPNVRLAACEALFRLRADPRVGEAFVQSLPIQTDPNVQITLIEMLVELNERRAVPQLERLAKRRDALPVVRKQAEAGIGILI
ncbi:HEAT repeat domain-containing protein [Hymenobacter sp. BT491]|uniref:HEAT repeat domain-containing protein n=1 Tax=Hymenobacter sp. BT491 TaxID=2766779 RepID=UPI001653DB33|nr:HEAT repeat domain-containing protein [Hymenobacter sp. BT491]MBC6990599.1 HEAT repeat domain-containing protein [Hymenobacter sp. BT491]